MWPFGRRKQQAEFARQATLRLKRLFPLASVEVSDDGLHALALPREVDFAIHDWFREWRSAGAHRAEVLDTMEDALALSVGFANVGGPTADEREVLRGGADTMDDVLRKMAELDPEGMGELEQIAAGLTGPHTPDN
ncbi:MAG: hypothetical protein GXP55_04145 [Deltaproteobacteria bacterium]|nr:hypothetical protein [Deltaproteobacteria bacterium]